MPRRSGTPLPKPFASIRIFEELRGLGYEGGYDAVRRYARSWRKDRVLASVDACVPLTFEPGEVLAVRLEPRDRADQRHDGDGEGCPPEALSLAHAVRAGLSARDAGDGVRLSIIDEKPTTSAARIVRG
jgi:hypothetical protein